MSQKVSVRRTAPHRKTRRKRKPHLILPILAAIVLAELALMLRQVRPVHGDAPSVFRSLTDSSVSESNAEDMTDSESGIPEQTGLDAESIPERLLELAEANPETVDFVRQYPELHDLHPEIDLREEAGCGTVPLLLQWDTRWGYETYGDGMIAYTGCGPTCMSMVALYLTGNPDASPLFVAQDAQAAGYYVNGSGTAWSFMSQGAGRYGLRSKELPLSESSMKGALDGGMPIICVVGPGDFTPKGHFLVVIG
jgi:hypothetical protein